MATVSTATGAGVANDAASTADEAQHVRVRQVLAEAIARFNAIPHGRQVTMPDEATQPVRLTLAFQAAHAVRGCLTLANPVEHVEAWTFPSHPGVYVDAANGLVGFLRHSAPHTKATAVHFTIVACRAPATRQPGARLRFLACMHNLRLNYTRNVVAVKDMSEECAMLLVGSDAVIETGMRLLLAMEATDTACPDGVSLYRGCREDFPKGIFLQLGSFLWAHAVVLEDAIGRLLLPALASLLAVIDAAACACAACVAYDALADGGGLGTGAGDADKDSGVLVPVVTIPVAWVAPSETARTLGDFMYQIALMTDEALFQAAHPGRFNLPHVPFPHISAMAHASMRFSQHMVEKLIRQNTTFYRIWGAPGDGMLASIVDALSGDWTLTRDALLADVLMVLIGHLRRGFGKDICSTPGWDAEEVVTALPDAPLGGAGGAGEGHAATDGAQRPDGDDDDEHGCAQKRARVDDMTPFHIQVELELLTAWVPRLHLERLDAPRRKTLLSSAFVQKELLARDGCLLRLYEVMARGKVRTSREELVPQFLLDADALYQQLVGTPIAVACPGPRPVV